MRIGIIIDIDNVTLLPYLTKEKDKNLVKKHGRMLAAPAVNTLINSFLKAGHFVRIFTVLNKEFTIKAPQVEVYSIQGYSKYPIKYLWKPFINANRLKHLIKGKIGDLDVLHAHWTYEFAYAAAHYEKEIPVFCTVRDCASYIWKIESLKNKISWTFNLIMNNMVFRHKNIHFIANSPYTARMMKIMHNIDLPIIPNSIKDCFIKKDIHTPPKVFKILCISSSNDKRKNVISLLKAFRIFKEKHSEACLQLIGSPFVSGEDKIEKWRKMGLLDAVELMGGIPHDLLTTYIDNCSVFVTPSLEETFGNTILESIVRKVPVIGGQDSGAVPYVLHNGDAGYLCNVKSPQDLCNMIDFVYNHPTEAQFKADDAFNIILSEYSEDVVCKRHIEIYQSYTNR